MRVQFRRGPSGCCWDRVIGCSVGCLDRNAGAGAGCASRLGPPERARRAQRAGQVRRLWIAAATEQPAPPTADRLGRPVGECDPLVLEVHPAVQVPGTEPEEVLPAYVSRAHDARLRKIVDGMLDGGRSRLVTLVGGSSTGKTRASWELALYLESQRPNRWRLWHPYDPTRPQAAW